MTHIQVKGLLGDSSARKVPLLPLQKPSSSQNHRSSFSLSYNRMAFLFLAIASALLLISTLNVHFSTQSPSKTHHGASESPEFAPLHDYGYDGVPGAEEHDQVVEHPHPYNEPEYDEEDDSEDEESVDETEDGEFEGGYANIPTGRQHRQPLRVTFKAPVEGIIPPACPNLFLTTETSFNPPSYSSSSTVPPTSLEFTSSSFSISSPVLLPDQVSCQPILSQLQDYSLAFCVSILDCSRGFIQIVNDPTSSATDNSENRIRVSKNASHDQYFRQVAGPDDFYFVLEGAQRLALSAHLVSMDLLVNQTDNNDDSSSTSELSAASLSSQKLVYRANFRMTLPGPVQLSGWLTYEKFRAVRENRPGTWPQWTHSVLIDSNTTLDATAAAKTRFTICPDCELDSFLKQVKTFREEHFEQCDRMAPVRGAYWKEDLAVKVYSEQDTVNRSPGAGAFFERVDGKNKQQNKLTRGWRFVPHGCTMTQTSNLPNASSNDPYITTCDSIASPTTAMRSPRYHQGDDADASSNSSENSSKDDYPRRRILFTGDSQVRTTYNAILNHYRPIDPAHQSFSAHNEFLPGQEFLDVNNTITSHPTGAVRIPQKDGDTDIELAYRADQFLDFLVASTDEELDKYDTIYLNLGQWPASGPVAGGQWSTEQLLGRWEEVVRRLNRWKESRGERIKARALYSNQGSGVTIDSENSSNVDDVKKELADPIEGSGKSSSVIWAGMNAFPMRTDASIRVKGDWRTNARLGYWDDWIETILQEAGGWFRRMNAWQLTFPMLDQVTDKAHFQLTDAIDALKLEALYKLDLCSRMSPDAPYSDSLDTTKTTNDSIAVTTA